MDIKKNDLAWFAAGFIGGPVLLNISPAVTSFFWWLGVASVTLFAACWIGVALGFLSLDEEGLK